MIDLFNGEVLSYTLGVDQRMPVLDMLRAPVQRLKDARPILHTDQGWQYQHVGYRRMLREHGVTRSMSRKGTCLDHAAAESFFSHFKQEFLRPRRFDSVRHFRQKLEAYLYWYDHHRIKGRLGWPSPADYRDNSRTLG